MKSFHKLPMPIWVCGQDSLYLILLFSPVKQSSTSLSKAEYIKDCDMLTYFGNKVAAVSQVDKISSKQNTGFF